MDLLRAVDIYCERVSAAFWAEPLNALTNIAFIMAGVAAVRARARVSPAGSWREVVAAIAMAAGLVSILSQLITIAFAAGAGGVLVPVAVLVLGTSVALVIAGLVAAPRLWREPRPDFAVAWLAGNAVVVGIGSFLFHTVAQPWAGIADSGPIVLFIIGYLAVTMRRFVGLSWRWSAVATVGVFAGMIAVSAGLRVARAALPPDLEWILNSSSYYPALLALLLIGAWLRLARGHPAGPLLMQAGGVFAVSLVFRTLDGPLCAVWPQGTHFLWHLCNGALFWVLLGALVRHGGAEALSPRPRTAREAAA